MNETERLRELKDENERLHEFIDWLAKNLPPSVTITKRTDNGLYDCSFKEKASDE